MLLNPQKINKNKFVSMNRDANQIQKQVQLSLLQQLPIKKPVVLTNPNNTYGKKSIQQLLSNFEMPQNGILSNNKIKQSQKQVPSSVKTLDKMCQMMGLQQMGQIYERPGNKYLARQINRTNDGSMFYSDTKLNQIGYIQTPDIRRNLYFHSGRAIQKWNDFVQAEANMRIYMQKIQRNKNNPSYVNQLAKSSSFGTSMYKILATLYYFYVKNQTNILNLEYDDVNKLVITLQKTQKLQQAYNSVIKLMKNNNGDQDYRDRVSFIRDYQIKKNNYFKASLTEQIFNQIKGFLQDKNAYLTDQMINTPTRQLPRWTNLMIQPEINSNVFKTDRWQPNSVTFKPNNYLQL